MIDMKKRRDDFIGYYDPYRVEMGSWNHLSTENILCPTLLYLAEILILISLEIGFGVDPNKPSHTKYTVSASVSVLGGLKVEKCWPVKNLTL